MQWVRLAAGVLLLKGLEAGLGQVFAGIGLTFPASVGAMLLVFLVLLVVDRLVPAATAPIIRFFAPSVSFLSGWMALFFVPALVGLSVVPLPSISILARVTVLLVVGFLLTLLTTGWLAERLLTRTEAAPEESFRANGRQWGRLWAVWMGILVLGGVGRIAGVPYSADVWMLAATVIGFFVGVGLQSLIGRARPSVLTRMASGVVHPVITGSFIGWLGLQVVSQGVTAYLHAPFGSGRFLLALLGPAVVALGFLLFERRGLLWMHARPVLVSLLVSAPFTLFSTALLSHLLRIPDPYGRAAIPRSVTTPIAMPIAELFGVDPALTASYVVLTGVFGAVWGTALLKVFRLEHPVAIGVAMGASAHGVGTAALLRDEPRSATLSSISFALMGAFTTVIASFNLVRELLVRLL